MTSPHPALRLTPSNSPFFKSSTPRSPVKSARSEEPALHLKKVIGTTTSSANAFDCLPGKRKFAFTAGAAAVVATVDDALTVTQHFFRANPTSTTVNRDGGWPLSPTPNEARHRAVGTLKEQSAAGSPISSSTKDWADSPGRSTSAKDRVKAATSVALSPNGKWLAVGETGYKPRVLIFSLRDGSSETPVAILSEHTFGVHALSFSPDSRSLASLGVVNDGFLFVWSIDDRTGIATLSASNKCTTIVNSMTWVGRNILTAGLRFVKLWRPDDGVSSETRATDVSSRASVLVTPRPKLESRLSDFGNSILSPKHRTLAGKNCLLGDLLGATFVCAIATSDSKAILCTDVGDICLLDDSDRTQSLTVATNAGMRITAARVDDRDMLHTAGVDGNTASFLVPDLQRRAGTPGQSRRPSGAAAFSTSGIATIAVANVGNAIVEIDSNRVIKLSCADRSDALHQLTAHEDAVLGVQALRSTAFPEAAFLTYSGNGTVLLWSAEGISVSEALRLPVEDSPDMYGMPNELKTVATLVDGTMIASGDKYGTVTVMDLRKKSIVHQLRAHSAEVLDLVEFVRDGVQYLASASRDRTVQLFLFSNGQLELLQTMDEHAGAVTGLLMSHDNEQLFSCSADRSVVVRQGILRATADPTSLAFGMLRAITLKSAPTSMCLTTQADTLLIASVDRCIGKYSTKNTQPGFSFKCSDPDGGEAVVMSKIIYTPSLHGNPTIAGVSSSDKSVRLYTEYGTLIARDLGHTEGITDIAFVSAEPGFQYPHIVTVAADSTIFLWDSKISNVRSTEGSFESAHADNDPALATSVPLAPPLRRVISHSELSRVRRGRSTDEQDSPSPVGNISNVPPVSPKKLRKTTSRTSLTQTPRIEPGPRANFDPSRRRSLKSNRSPSPPSSRHIVKKESTQRPSLGMSLRSTKSSESLRHSNTSPQTNGAGFGSLTSSTESVCRTLRVYRKKLTNSSSTETIVPDTLRELEKELKLTARAVGEQSQGKNLNEAMMAKLLDQASDKIVDFLDERLKSRVESGAHRYGQISPSVSTPLEPPSELDEHLNDGIERSDTAPGALETRDVPP